jgi:uncharacterized membrane protein YagU involved in acid resistance
VGVLDATDGVVYAGLTAGNNPIEVLQYIASGVLGPSAYSGGLAAAGLGVLIHFALAYGFTAAFLVAWKRVGAIRRAAPVAGLAWGALVWAFMNLVALPLSRVQPSSFTALGVIHGVVGHSLFVGLAASMVARLRMNS